MNDYRQVQEALAGGADPAMMCQTCPWTRQCVEPPPMTQQDVEAGVDKMRKTAEEKGGQHSFAGVLIGALAYAGRDTNGPMCPVFVLRLRSSDGRDLADTIKATLQAKAEVTGG